MRHCHNDEGGRYEQFVRKRVEEPAKARLLVQSTRKEPIRKIGQAREKKNRQRKAKSAFVDQI